MWTIEAVILHSSGIWILKMFSTLCLNCSPLEVSLTKHDANWSLWNYSQWMAPVPYQYAISEQTWPLPILVGGDGLLSGNQYELVWANKKACSCWARQRNPCGAWGDSWLRRFCTCPVCKRNKFIEQSMLKPSRRGADIQISATECSVLAVLQALISAHGYQLHCWAAWMVSGRKKKPWYLLFLRIFLIFSDQKNQPSCPVSAFCPRLTLNPDRSSCLIFLRLSRNSWNYLKAAIWAI